MTGEELRNLRSGAGFKAYEIARLLGYREQRWSRFERGKSPIPPAVEYAARWVCENQIQNTDPSKSAVERAMAILIEAFGDRLNVPT